MTTRDSEQGRAHQIAASVAALALVFVSACATGRQHRITAPSPARTGTVTAGWSEEGLASWYGEPYHGRQTASGERYDMREMTAAHRTLPFGTRLRVENLDSGKRASVLVNDRGPFVDGRILDLSWAAARALDAVGPGVVPVRITIERAGNGMLDEPCWEVQIGAFANTENANRAKGALEQSGHAVRLAPAGGGLTRVRATGLSGRDRALVVARELGVSYPGAVAVPCGGGW